MAEAHQKVVPVTVLTGFLGSGKTTLLNHILKSREHGMRFAIIENEFGEVGVDEKVITEATDEEVIEVMNGCICCTVRGDLTKVLKKLYERVENFDGVIIETTGLADPAPVAQTFFVEDEIKKLYKLDGIVTVVDAKHIVQHLEEEKPEGVENESVEQVAFADRVLLNKTDLVPDTAELEAIEAKIHAINSEVPIIRCCHSAVDPKSLLFLDAFSLDKVLEKEPDFLDTDGEHQHDLSVSSVSCKFQGELNENKLQRWIGEIIPTQGTDLFRYKGVLACKGYDTKYVFHGVHMLYKGEFSTMKWAKDEVRECRFVFIGKNLDKKALEDGFRKCRAETELRFKVGDMVEAKCGKWKLGKVTKLWDDGYPYLIELSGGSCCWGPEDIDDYVRVPRKGAEDKGGKKGKGKGKESEEKRIDPEDNVAYTWEEMFAHYKGTYKKQELVAYWEETCKPVKGKGKGKGGKGEEEKRIDPEDNRAYTWEEMFAHYKGIYKRQELVAYWEETCKPTKKRR